MVNTIQVVLDKDFHQSRYSDGVFTPKEYTGNDSVIVPYSEKTTVEKAFEIFKSAPHGNKPVIIIKQDIVVSFLYDVNKLFGADIVQIFEYDEDAYILYPDIFEQFKGTEYEQNITNLFYIAGANIEALLQLKDKAHKRGLIGMISALDEKNYGTIHNTNLN